MAIWVSVSGGSRMTRFLPVVIDQPPGTVKVAPPGVVRGVSAATRSGAGLVSCWVDAGDGEPAAAPCTRVMSRMKANRAHSAIRRIDMLVTKCREDLKTQEYKHYGRVASRPARAGAFRAGVFEGFSPTVRVRPHERLPT